MKWKGKVIKHARGNEIKEFSTVVSFEERDAVAQHLKQLLSDVKQLQKSSVATPDALYVLSETKPSEHVGLMIEGRHVMIKPGIGKLGASSKWVVLGDALSDAEIDRICTDMSRNLELNADMSGRKLSTELRATIIAATLD